MFRRMGLLVVAGLLLFTAGCITSESTSDTTDPEITITVLRGRGGNIYRSSDGELAPGDNCIKVPGTPVQLTMVVTDLGGVESASIQVFPGAIDPGSLEITPPAPESSYAIRTDRLTQFLDINLTPPSAGTVRTGATAVLHVDGDLPIAIRAYARDYAGNEASLGQFDLRAAADDVVLCRGDL